MRKRKEIISDWYRRLTKWFTIMGKQKTESHPPISQSGCGPTHLNR
jgi:hypothetical protein